MNLIKKLSTRSPWLFRINAGSCNGCDVELATTACISRYDVERLGCKYCGSLSLRGSRTRSCSSGTKSPSPR